MLILPLTPISEEQEELQKKTVDDLINNGNACIVEKVGYDNLWDKIVAVAKDKYQVSSMRH